MFEREGEEERGTRLEIKLRYKGVDGRCSFIDTRKTKYIVFEAKSVNQRKPKIIMKTE